MKKNGFTLIELLAVVVILSVVMTIAVVSVRGIIENTKKTYYQDLEKTTIDALITYFSDNRGKLPKVTGEKTSIDLADLVTEKYLEQLVDEKEKACRGTGYVRRIGTGKYDYHVCISCPSLSENVGDGC